MQIQAARHVSDLVFLGTKTRTPSPLFSEAQGKVEDVTRSAEIILHSFMSLLIYSFIYLGCAAQIAGS